MTTIRVSDDTKAKLKSIANGRTMDKFMQILIDVYNSRHNVDKSIQQIELEDIREVIREELNKIRGR